MAVMGLQNTGNGMEGLTDISAGLTPSTAETAVHTELQFLVGFFNDFIVLAITLVACAFFFYLTQWIYSGSNRDQERNAAKGAIKGFIAMLLVLNIWYVLGAIQYVAGLSNIVAFGVFSVFIFLLSFWSLFGIGDSIVILVSRGIENITDFVLTKYGQRIKLKNGSIAILHGPLLITFLLLFITLVVFVFNHFFW